jgi:hypothetical protein
MLRHPPGTPESDPTGHLPAGVFVFGTDQQIPNGSRPAVVEQAANRGRVHLGAGHQKRFSLGQKAQGKLGVGDPTTGSVTPGAGRHFNSTVDRVHARSSFPIFTNSVFRQFNSTPSIQPLVGGYSRFTLIRYMEKITIPNL